MAQGRKKQAEDDDCWEVVATATGNPVPLAGGYSVFSRFTLTGTCDDPRPSVGTLTVTLEVEATDEGRAAVRSLAVGTDRPRGIGSTVLRSLPFRKLIVKAATEVFMRVEMTAGAKGPEAKLTPIRRDDPAALAAVEEFVGYVEVS